MDNLLPYEKVEREIIIKKKAKTSDKFGCRPEDRSVEELINYGIVNIDKPKGPTSHQVSAYVQKILGIKKAGHSGTLDPAVTGVLPITLGKATKIVQLLLLAGKEYVTLMHVHKDVDEYELHKAMSKFIGKIKQLPPVKSAVKRRVRDRKIYYLDVLDIKKQDVLFKVGCEAGTYIRKLVHDMGLSLDSGAHMQELRRSKVALINEETIVTLQDLADAVYYWKEEGNEEPIRKAIMPLEKGAEHLPKIWVLDSTVDSLCNGTNLKVPGIVKFESGIELDQAVAIMTLKDEIICFGRAKMSSLELQKNDRGIVASTDKVFLKSGTYPKYEKEE